MAKSRQAVVNLVKSWDGKKESNGLGLAIVKSIAECYQIEVDYRFDGGKHIFELIFVK